MVQRKNNEWFVILEEKERDFGSGGACLRTKRGTCFFINRLWISVDFGKEGMISFTFPGTGASDGRSELRISIIPREEGLISGREETKQGRSGPILPLSERRGHLTFDFPFSRRIMSSEQSSVEAAVAELKAEAGKKDCKNCKW